MIKIYSIVLTVVIGVSTTFAQIPEGYYDNTDNLSGEELKLKLHQIIRNHTVRSYSEFRDTILPNLDEDPNNSDNIILFYKNNSIPKSDFANGNDSWNREHTWPSSHGFSNDSDSAYTDVHNLRPADASVNGSKSNKDFNDVEHIEENEEGDAPDTFTTSDFFEPRDDRKGDVARILFYMAVRYNSERLDLELVDRISLSGEPELGVLYTLIQWHELDPVDDAEQARHDGAYGYQGNRNPFIDHPEWVGEIWGTGTEPFLATDLLNFSNDFGQVELGTELVQTYSIKAYNLIDDVSVEVNEPFSLSLNQNEWSDSIGYSNDSSGEQILDIYIRYQPGQADEDVSAIVSHYTDGDTVRFEISGREGSSEVMTIAEARTMSPGEAVYVSGVVIDKGNNSSNNRVIYDGTAGIMIRSFDEGNESASLVYGDSITVSGVLDEYNRLLQISESPIRINLIAQDKPVPEPQEVTLSDINESHESELIIVRNVSFASPGSTFRGGGASGNFYINDGTGDFIFRIGSDNHPLVGETIPRGKVDLVGIVGQFGNDYQISPRDVDDITVIETTLGVELPSNEMVLFPNPTRRFLSIQSNVVAEGDEVTVLSLTGKQLFKSYLNAKSVIDVSSLGSGSYILLVNTQSSLYYARFVKD